MNEWRVCKVREDRHGEVFSVLELNLVSGPMQDWEQEGPEQRVEDVHEHLSAKGLSTSAIEELLEKAREQYGSRQTPFNAAIVDRIAD